MNFVFTVHVKLKFTVLVRHYIHSWGTSSDRHSLISCFIYLDFQDSNDFYFNFKFGFIVEFAAVVFCSASKDRW